VTNGWVGYLDEVRFSDSVLGASDFLVAVPEPGSFALLAGLFGLAGVALRRRA